MGDYYYNENPNPNQEENPGMGFGIAALVLGIISVFCFCVGLNVILAILAIVFGALHIQRHKSDGRKGLGIAGVVLGIVSILFGILFWALVIFSFGKFYYEPSDILEEYHDTFEEFIENVPSDSNTF